jgi:hypothetical protein
VEVTTESADVKPYQSLDTCADAITKCTNYRVTLEAEKARFETHKEEILEQINQEGREIQEKLDEAIAMEKMAKDKLRDMVRTLCGVKIEDEDDGRAE